MPHSKLARVKLSEATRAPTHSQVTSRAMECVQYAVERRGQTANGFGTAHPIDYSLEQGREERAGLPTSTADGFRTAHHIALVSKAEKRKNMMDPECFSMDDGAERCRYEKIYVGRESLTPPRSCCRSCGPGVAASRASAVGPRAKAGQRRPLLPNRRQPLT